MTEMTCHNDTQQVNMACFYLYGQWTHLDFIDNLDAALPGIRLAYSNYCTALLTYSEVMIIR